MERSPKAWKKEFEIRRGIETLQATVLLRSARIIKSSGDLRRFAVTQTQTKYYQQGRCAKLRPQNKSEGM